MNGLDKVSLEILINRFQAVVDEMAQVIYRTAHTVFVKETQDYGAVLVSPKGEVFAAPRRYGVLMMIGMPMNDAIARMGDDVREGDIFISTIPTAPAGWSPTSRTCSCGSRCSGKGARVLRLELHARQRRRRAGDRQHRAFELRGLPGRDPHSAATPVPGRRARSHLPQPLPLQYPHPRTELGRHERLPRRPRHRGAPRACPARPLRPSPHRSGDRRGARLRGDPGTTRHRPRSGWALPALRLHRSGHGRPRADPHQPRNAHRRRRDAPRFHRHRPSGARRAQPADPRQARALDAHHRTGELDLHPRARHRLQRGTGAPDEGAHPEGLHPRSGAGGGLRHPLLDLAQGLRREHWRVVPGGAGRAARDRLRPGLHPDGGGAGVRDRRHPGLGGTADRGRVRGGRTRTVSTARW